MRISLDLVQTTKIISKRIESLSSEAIIKYFEVGTRLNSSINAKQPWNIRRAVKEIENPTAH